MKPDQEDRLYKAALWIEPALEQAVKMLLVRLLLLLAQHITGREALGSPDAMFAVLLTFVLWVRLRKPDAE